MLSGSQDCDGFDMPQSLAPLRRALECLAIRRPGVPVGEIIRLARDVAGDDFTIDFAAGREIGVPVLVLRAPVEAPNDSLQALSRRERQIAGLIARGARNKEIAIQLGISLATVKDHIHNALTKTGFATRAQLAAAVGRRTN